MKRSIINAQLSFVLFAVPGAFAAPPKMELTVTWERDYFFEEWADAWRMISRCHDAVHSTISIQASNDGTFRNFGLCSVPNSCVAWHPNEVIVNPDLATAFGCVLAGIECSPHACGYWPWCGGLVYVEGGEIEVASEVPFWTHKGDMHSDDGGYGSTPKLRHQWHPWHHTLGSELIPEIRYTYCREDLDASGEIDMGDLSLLLFELYKGIPRCDFDESGEVDTGDLSWLLLNLGRCQVPDV